MCSQDPDVGGQATRIDEAVRGHQSLAGTTILDESPRMMLIEAPDESALRAVLDPSTWLLTEEAFYELPSPQEEVVR